MLKIRVDDFPHTKGEPQHSLEAFREFHRELSALIGGRQYLLGVIPKRCSVDDLLFIRNETDCAVGMHGIEHREDLLDLYQNEFPPFFSAQDVGRKLLEVGHALEQAVGRDVRIYMPPRNRIDERTVSVLLDAGFVAFTAGPETDSGVLERNSLMSLPSMPPYEYGRTDELLQRGAHLRLIEKSERGDEVILTLHWTWETNIGLRHMREFLSLIPKRHFTDFYE